MHISVNGVRLFFDVEGTKFVPEGPHMREKPTLLLLHGGPGFDHSIYRPAYSLVLGGEDDPIHPIESQADIAAALPAHLVQFERFEDCRHAVVPDAPERAMAVLRAFLTRPK
jgi:pimeloyl-ACP methyl ester carboxylesterase